MHAKRVKRILVVAAAGATLAIVFVTFGASSVEPSDHALDPTGGAIAFALMPFCFPAYLLHALVVSPAVWWALPYMRFGRFADYLIDFVTYPAVQGVLYGAIAWLVLASLDHFRNQPQKRFKEST